MPIIDKVLRLSSLTNKGLLISTLISNNNHLNDQCVALNHHQSSIRPLTTNCARCRYIEDELFNDFSRSLANDPQKTADIGVQHKNEPTVLNVSSIQKNECSSNIESVWQVDDGRTAHFSDKQSTPKVEVVQDDNNARSEIDSTSFIILRDDDDGAGITNRSSTQSGPEEELRKNSSSMILNLSSRGQCDDCCYCNPSLHQNDGASNERVCNYCKSAKPVDTPLSEDTHENAAEHKSSSGTNTSPPLQPETGTVYEEKLTTKDHTHVRTKSKDSDTVSLKCTKINSKIRRIIPEDDINIEILSNLHRKKTDQSKQRQRAKPMASNSSGWNNRGRATEETTEKCETESKPTGKADPTKSIRCKRRSRPFDVISSPSYDSSHHCSSSSSSAASPKREIVFPAAGRMRSNSTVRERKLANERMSRYQDFYANNGDRQNNNNRTDVMVTESKRANENSVIPATMNHSQSEYIETFRFLLR